MWRGRNSHPTGFTQRRYRVEITVGVAADCVGGGVVKGSRHPVNGEAHTLRVAIGLGFDAQLSGNECQVDRLVVVQLVQAGVGCCVDQPEIGDFGHADCVGGRWRGLQAEAKGTCREYGHRSQRPAEPSDIAVTGLAIDGIVHGDGLIRGGM